MLADQVVFEGCFDYRRARLFRTGTSALEIKQVRDARSCPKCSNARTVFAGIQCEVACPCTADRVTDNTNRITRAKCTRGSCSYRYWFTQVQIRHDRRVCVDNNATRPLHGDVGNLWLLKFVKQTIHFLADFMQRTDNRERAASNLGCLAHEPAIRRRAYTDCEQARVTKVRFDKTEKTLFISHGSIGYENDLSQVRLRWCRSQGTLQCRPHVGAAICLQPLDEALRVVDGHCVGGNARREKRVRVRIEFDDIEPILRLQSIECALQCSFCLLD